MKNEIWTKSLQSRSTVPKRSKDRKNYLGPSVHSDRGYTAAKSSAEMRVPSSATARWLENQIRARRKRKGDTDLEASEPCAETS